MTEKIQQLTDAEFTQWLKLELPVLPIAIDVRALRAEALADLNIEFGLEPDGSDWDWTGDFADVRPAEDRDDWVGE